MTSKVLKHLCDTKPVGFFIVNKSGASGAARNFAEARVGSDDELEMNLCIILKDDVTDAMGLTELGWMCCQGLRNVWEIPSPPRLRKLAGWAFTLLPMPLSPQGGVLAQGRFPSGHERTQLMLKIELS